MTEADSTPKDNRAAEPGRGPLIERIIEASAKNKFLVFLFTIFAVGGGIYGLLHTPLDAIPDLSDVQVIVYTDWEGRSPDLVEDQITYPISTVFIAAPKVKFVRGESMFGKSFVYVIFEDGTDIYWARSRVIEYLSAVRGMLPEGVNPVIGPDATGVGWVFEYAVVDKSGEHNLAELRSFQDWHLKYWLASVPGVAEVASIGGFVKQYQLNVDPVKLAAFNIGIGDVVRVLKASNNDVEGRLLEFSGREYMVRGRGYLTSLDDIESVSLGADPHGTPVRVRDVAQVRLGPDIRRGVAERRRRVVHPDVLPGRDVKYHVTRRARARHRRPCRRLDRDGRERVPSRLRVRAGRGIRGSASRRSRIGQTGRSRHLFLARD